MLLWDLAAGVALRRYASLNKPVVGLAFVPGGDSFLVAADTDAVYEVRVDASQDSLLAWITANRTLPELTCPQRQQYNVEPMCK